MRYWNCHPEELEEIGDENPHDYLHDKMVLHAELMEREDEQEKQTGELRQPVSG